MNKTILASLPTGNPALYDEQTLIRQSRITGPRIMARLGPLDPRQAAWRNDLADIALAGLIAVPNYARPVPMRVVPLSAPLYAAPDGEMMTSELLHGEGFALLESDNGWGWGYALADHYVGYVRMSALVTDPAAENQARIGPGDGLLFASPSIKAPIVATLPMGALVVCHPHDEQFLRLADGPFAGAFLHRRHLLPDNADWVELAMHFLGAPYRWGGRTRAGVDCSGLVQVARQLAGFPTRRDSDMQAADTPQQVESPRRGDLACWPGHIGIMLDETHLLHANAHWMRCVIEPLADVISRAGQNGGTAEPELRRPPQSVANRPLLYAAQ